MPAPTLHAASASSPSATAWCMPPSNRCSNRSSSPPSTRGATAFVPVVRSPLLCNLYLHALDAGVSELAQLHHHGVRVLRYADDLLLLARDARLASLGIAVIRQTLDRLRQRLRDPQARPRPLADGVDWLGV